MSQSVRKLLAAILTLLISVTMIVAITYAWTTLSASPVAEGIQITVGGGNTILVAPDIALEVEGKTYHYPGGFSDKLILSRYEGYDYLKTLDSLMPVSTADGVNWFIPEYYDILDEEVINGDASVGQIKPYSEFHRDTTLTFANLEDNGEAKGSYIYLDFWVVSPGSDYTLRVSRGDSNGGSFLLELPEIVEDGDSYTLKETNGSVSAAARIGFLANTVYLTDETMYYYQRSYGYDSDYSRLCGNFSNAGEEYFSIDNRFTIYEPNGLLHPGREEDGSYIPTNPIGFRNGVAAEADIRDRLTVQVLNVWKDKDNATITLPEIFKTAIANKNIDSAEEAKSVFSEYLQGSYTPYVIKGQFVQKTNSLYALCADNNIADSEELLGLNLAGATDDAYIVKLEKNVPQKIRMFIWIEGQDTDCTALENVCDFAISIELAGSNKEDNE